MVKVKKSSNPFQFGTAQKKLLIVFCYYVVLCVVALTSYTVTTKNTPIMVKSAKKHFFCEQSGHDPNEPCSRSEFEKLTNASGITLSYTLLMAVFPAVNLVYVVNIRELKELWKKCFAKKKRNLSFSNPIAVNTISMTQSHKDVQ